MDKEHFLQVENILKKSPLWKYIAFGLACIEQEYAVYEILAKDRKFDMSKFLKKTVKRFWKAAVTGYSIDEQYLLAIEESFFEPRDEWENLALEIIQDIYDFFYAVAEKKANKALEMQERQIILIENYAELTGHQNYAEKLIKDTYAHHKELALELSSVQNKEKKKFLSELETREDPDLLGKNFLEYRPKITKEKPDKKKLPEIRITSIDFDRESKLRDNKWLMTATTEQLAKGARPKNSGGAIAEAYDKGAFVDVCCHMELLGRIYAEDDWLQNQNPERVRGFWYMSVLAGLRAYQLYDNGFPVYGNNILYYLSKRDADRNNIPYLILRAYAVGAEDLFPELLAVAVDKKKAETVIKVCSGENNDELYKNIELWENSDIRSAFLAILKNDSKGLRKTVLHMIRHDRQMYNLNCTFIDYAAYALMRLAKELKVDTDLKNDSKGLRKTVLHMIRHDRQMYDLNCTFTDYAAYALMRLAKELKADTEPIIASEVLNGNLNCPSVDRNIWQIGYQKEIDEWLNSKV